MDKRALLRETGGCDFDDKLKDTRFISPYSQLSICRQLIKSISEYRKSAVGACNLR